MRTNTPTQKWPPRHNSAQCFQFQTGGGVLVQLAVGHLAVLHLRDVGTHLCDHLLPLVEPRLALRLLARAPLSLLVQPPTALLCGCRRK